GGQRRGTGDWINFVVLDLEVVLPSTIGTASSNGLELVDVTRWSTSKPNSFEVNKDGSTLVVTDANTLPRRTRTGVGCKARSRSRRTRRPSWSAGPQ
ncbi:MAG: hypothetical protein OXE44_06470, partial [Nitrospinae bacterium]|nr:hypothetical protein [Nitrospinota bacterium]